MFTRRSATDHPTVIPIFACEYPEEYEELDPSKRRVVFLAGATVFNGRSWRSEALRYFQEHYESSLPLFVAIPEAAGFQSWGVPGVIPSFSSVEQDLEASSDRMQIANEFYPGRQYNQLAWETFWISRSDSRVMWLSVFFNEQLAGPKFCNPSGSLWRRTRGALDGIIRDSRISRRSIKKLIQYLDDHSDRVGAIVPANTGCTVRIETGEWLHDIRTGTTTRKYYFGAPNGASGLAAVQYHLITFGMRMYREGSGSDHLVSHEMLQRVLDDLRSSDLSDGQDEVEGE